MSGYVRPSATTADQRLNALLDQLTTVTAQRDQACAAIARARAYHKQRQLVLQDGTTAGGGCAHCEYAWPCPTITALDAKETTQ